MIDSTRRLENTCCCIILDVESIRIQDGLIQGLVGIAVEGVQRQPGFFARRSEGRDETAKDRVRAIFLDIGYEWEFAKKDAAGWDVARCEDTEAFAFYFFDVDEGIKGFRVADWFDSWRKWWRPWRYRTNCAVMEGAEVGKELRRLAVI